MASDKLQEGFEVLWPTTPRRSGARCQVSPHGRPEFVVYVENAGDFAVSLDAVE